jgi:hypothetical protein
LRLSRPFAALLGLGFGLSFVPAAASAGPPSGQTVAGIRCDKSEGVAFHIHPHLALYDGGKAVVIPSDVGRPFGADCLYWLHTHSDDGIIHVESPVAKTFTLADFFAVWGQPLGPKRAGPVRSANPLRVYVNGAAYKGDPRKIELAQHTDIVVEAGPPWVKPVPFTGWNGQ